MRLSSLKTKRQQRKRLLNSQSIAKLKKKSNAIPTLIKSKPAERKLKSVNDSLRRPTVDSLDLEMEALDESPIKSCNLEMLSLNETSFLTASQLANDTSESMEFAQLFDTPKCSLHRLIQI